MSGPQVDLYEVSLQPRSFNALSDHLANGAYERLRVARRDAGAALDGRTVWWINSTSQGGGVAEMLRTLLPYWLGSGVDTRWLVLDAPSDFFSFTKRLHNLLHGVEDQTPQPRDIAMYESVAQAAVAKAVQLIEPGDVVILEDPQTAGLVPRLKRFGATVIWRSHVGPDRENESVEDAWRFLLPHIEDADAFVFTRREYVPAALQDAHSVVLPPAIDPLSPKNQALKEAVAKAILRRCGLAQTGRMAGPTQVTLSDGQTVDIRRRCRVLREDRAPSLDTDLLVVALGRWDRLKDPVGIVRGFAGQVHHRQARLIVAGPATSSVADDPGARTVLREVHAAWHELDRTQRRRIDIVALPMVDLDENALMVNALQRQAAVIVKKSLQEGFGLGVTEGLWKARPVVATRVGGHKDQIEDHRMGLLIDDPTDLAAFGAAIDEMLDDPAQAHALASAGREHVRERFPADRHFVGWTTALRDVFAAAA